MFISRVQLPIARYYRAAFFCFYLAKACTSVSQDSQSTMSSASPLSPTFYGHIASTQDALLLFEACLRGTLNLVVRRPFDCERVSFINSGNVIIYTEQFSGIKRWTDGVQWSPSRRLGNFLVYRELERAFPKIEKRGPKKCGKTSPGISKPEPYGSWSDSINRGYSASTTASRFHSPDAISSRKQAERSLIGSLVDSYAFKQEGLVKKAISVTVGGTSYYLVSYYTVVDIINNKFTTPSKDPRFQYITPRPDLVSKQNFRTPIDEVGSMDCDGHSTYATYRNAQNSYDICAPSTLYHSLSQSASSAAIYGRQFAQSPGVPGGHVPGDNV